MRESTARTGLPSQPGILRGKQCNMYAPGCTCDSSAPSSALAFKKLETFAGGRGERHDADEYLSCQNAHVPGNIHNKHKPVEDFERHVCHVIGGPRRTLVVWAPSRSEVLESINVRQRMDTQIWESADVVLVITARTTPAVREPGHAGVVMSAFGRDSLFYACILANRGRLMSIQLPFAMPADCGYAAEHEASADASKGAAAPSPPEAAATPKRRSAAARVPRIVPLTGRPCRFALSQ
eukprot:scaffold40_cov413-Prasinococcus_capsulatus_cf.AAC.8